MKKLAIGLFMLSNAVLAQNSVGVDKDNGLPNAQLGAPLSSFKNMKLEKEYPNFKVYKRTSDKLIVGDVNVSEISYRFANDTLFAIGIIVKDMQAAQKLRQYGKSHYGPGEDGTRLNSCSWRGKKAQAMYMEDPQKSDATLSIGSKLYGPKLPKQ
jgi:hypothetical protein